MPVTYTFGEKRKLLHTCFWGTVTDADLENQAQSVASDERITGIFRELIDLTDVVSVETTMEGLRLVAHIDADNPKKFAGQRSAIIAPSDLLYGMARMFQQISESNSSPAIIKSFRTAAEAYSWLGIEP